MEFEEEAKIRANLEGSTLHGKVASSSAATVTEPAELTEEQALKASFEEAQALATQLGSVLSEACAAGEPMPEEAVLILRTLISSSAGARGWFVTLLTNPSFDALFRAPIDESLLTAIEASPDPNLRLMTMNVAMSSATELVHSANGNLELAAASKMTRERSGALLIALLGRMPGLSEQVEALLSAVQPWEEVSAGEGKATPPAEADEEWVKFTKKWRYGPEQREAIRSELFAIRAAQTAAQTAISSSEAPSTPPTASSRSLVPKMMVSPSDELGLILPNRLISGSPRMAAPAAEAEVATPAAETEVPPAPTRV